MADRACHLLDSAARVLRRARGHPAGQLRRDCRLPEDVVVVVLGRHDRPLEAALDSAGAAIIFARSAG